MKNCRVTLTSILGTGLLAFGLGACGVDDAGGGGGGVIDEPNPELVCGATLTVSGTIQHPGTPDTALVCDPLGTWTVNVTVDDPGDCDQNQIAYESTYVYNVTGNVDDGYVYSHMGVDAEDNDLLYVKVSGEGSTCSGEMHHYSQDGMQFVLLKPFIDINDDTGQRLGTLSGVGDFELYSTSQL